VPRELVEACLAKRRKERVHGMRLREILGVRYYESTIILKRRRDPVTPETPQTPEGQVLIRMRYNHSFIILY
jgi:hypothetical protein